MKSKEDKKIIRDFKSLNREQGSAILMLVFSLRKLELLQRKQKTDEAMKKLEEEISVFCWHRPKFGS